MMTSFFRGIASLGAPTNFEKARLTCTYKGDNEAPDRESLNALIEALSGKDQETRAEVAFRTLMVKLQYSDSLKNWNYIIKNLLILDRCVEDKLFLTDIGEMNFSHIENFIDEDARNTNMQIDELVKRYYKLIIEKARIYSERNSCFNVDKVQLAAYFKQCDIDKILHEIDNIKRLNDLIFELSKTDKKGYLKFNLNQFVYLLLLSSLMNYYTLHYIGIILLIDKLFSMNITQAIEFKRLYLNFIKSNDELITFIKNHQYINGFNISTSDFYKSDTRTFESIEQYIEVLNQNSMEKDENLIQLNNQQNITVFKTESLKEPLEIIDEVEEKKSMTDNSAHLKTKNEFAKLVNCDNSPLKKMKSPLLSHQKSDKKIIKKEMKNPILTIGEKESLISKENKEILNEEEEIEKVKKNRRSKKLSSGYQRGVLDLEDINFRKVNSSNTKDINNSISGVNNLKEIRRKTQNRRPSNINTDKIDFLPDYDQILFSNFPNGYSYDFNMINYKQTLKI